MQFPTAKKKRFDIVGVFLSAFITLAITAVFIYLISAVADGYAAVKINKLNDPYARSLELLNVIYLFAIGAVALLALEKARKSLTRKEDRYVYLRLPVKPRTIFISKFAALLLWTFSCAALIIIPVNVIFYIVLSPPPIYWIYTLFILILLPLVSFSAATLLLIPYIAVMNFIKDKYALIFIILTAIIIGAFAVYSKILGTVQSLVETGSVKFLFNARFVETLQKILKISYPANALASLALGQRVARSLLLSLLFVAIGIAFSMAIDTALYHITLYKNEGRAKIGRRRRTYTKHGVFASLLHKEFISVFRNRKHLFSYFAIATAMPVMVYCCYTLFESLISNAIGLQVNFSLALLVLLIFSILTNTFCATNITRDGLVALKSKMFPIKASTQLLAKVLFCAIVSSAAVIVSVIVLLFAGLSVWEGCLCGVVALAFSTAQIFIATRMDLNHAKVSASPYEIERINNRTISKVVVLGLILAIILGVLSMALFIFARMNTIGFIASLNLKTWYAYLIPVIGGLLYLGFALFYYLHKLEKSFEHMIS
jgi:ABC-2 type transport system permease protein